MARLFTRNFNHGGEYLERRTGVKKSYIYAIGCALGTLITLFMYGTQLLCSLIGVIYPMFASVAALEAPGDNAEFGDVKKWLKYWVVFAAMNVLEFFCWFWIWIPYFWLLKFLCLSWCILPNGEGTLFLYERVRRFLQN